MRYLVILPTNDQEIPIFIKRWLDESKGSLALATVREKIKEQFGYEEISICNSKKEACSMGFKGPMYQLDEHEIVSIPPLRKSKRSLGCAA